MQKWKLRFSAKVSEPSQNQKISWFFFRPSDRELRSVSLLFRLCNWVDSVWLWYELGLASPRALSGKPSVCRWRSRTSRLRARPVLLVLLVTTGSGDTLQPTAFPWRVKISLIQILHKTPEDCMVLRPEFTNIHILSFIHGVPQGPILGPLTLCIPEPYEFHYKSVCCWWTVFMHIIKMYKMYINTV